MKIVLYCIFERILDGHGTIGAHAKLDVNDTQGLLKQLQDFERLYPGDEIIIKLEKDDADR